jgi:hypothetical protein
MARSGTDMVTYLDADLYFFSDVEPIYDELGSDSVLIIPHHFAPAMRHKEIYGRYNVDWLCFRADVHGRACLEWWRDRANEWCRDTPDEVEGRFCKQRYLDYFSGRFAGVHVLAHRGANLAPWNIGNVNLSLHGNVVLANDARLIFFHFHGIKQVGPRRFFTVHRGYAAPMTALIRDNIYRPYLRELMVIERDVAPLMPASAAVLRHAALPDDVRFLSRLKLRVSLLRDWLGGYVISA